MQIEQIAADAATESRAAFTADPKAFEAAAAFLAKRVMERRNSIPILSHIRIEATPAGAVILSGTDLDHWAAVTLAADVESPGTICVEAGPLADALAKLRKGGAWEVRFADKGGCRAKVNASGVRAAFDLRGLPADDFPATVTPTVDEALSAFTVAAAPFLSDLAALAPCISTEETRYYLNGIALQVRDMAERPRLILAATDGHNMAVASRPIPVGAEALVDSILPRKAVANLAHAAKLAPGADTVAIEAGPRVARFDLGPVSITAKLIDGTFPAWEGVFDAAMAPTDGAAAMFPELLPGAPVDAMDKCAKGAKAKLDWQPSRDGFLGTVPDDDGLLFACMALRDGAGPRKGYAYQWSGQGDAESYLLALIETRGLVSPAAMAERAEAVNAAFGEEADSWDYNGGAPYRARPWGRATFEGAQLVQRGNRIMGLTIGGEVETRSWKETVQDWEALCEREIHHAGGREAIEGSYSIIMPADGPGALQAESCITGPDGVSYPVADNGNSIHLSKDQVRALIGESCFETMAVTMPDGSSAFILQWLWEQGDSRFLTVKANGRTYPGAPYVTRAEIESGPVEIEPEPVAEEAAAIECPEISSPEGAESDAEPIAAQESGEALNALSGPEIAPEEVEADPVADLAARVAAMEARLEALAVETGAGAENANNSSPEFIAPPSGEAARPKRTAAHERAIRRAWAERKARRGAQGGMAIHARRIEALERELRLAQNEQALDKQAVEEAYARAEQFARRGNQHAARRRASAQRARRLLATSRQAATFQRQRADVLAAQLDKLRADMADPIQPERASDIARLVRERDEARTALAAVNSRNASLQSALNSLGDKLEAMAVKVTLTERAARGAA